MHRKIMSRAAKALKKDATHYKKKASRDKGTKKKHDMVERKEALSASKDLKRRVRTAHEYK